MGLNKENKNYCYNIGRVVAVVEIINGLRENFPRLVFDNAKDNLPYQLREALKCDKHNLHCELIGPADIVLNGEIPSKEMTSIDTVGTYWIGYYHEKAYLADTYKGIYGKEEVTIDHHTPEKVEADAAVDNSIDELKR